MPLLIGIFQSQLKIIFVCETISVTEVWSVPVYDCDNFMYNLPFLAVQSACYYDFFDWCGVFAPHNGVFAGTVPGVLDSQFVQTCNIYSYLLAVLTTSVGFSSLPHLLCELN